MDLDRGARMNHWRGAISMAETRVNLEEARAKDNIRMSRKLFRKVGRASSGFISLVKTTVTKWLMGDPDSTALLNSLLRLLPFKGVPLRDSGPVRAVWLSCYHTIVHPQVFYALNIGLFRHCLT